MKKLNLLLLTGLVAVSGLISGCKGNSKVIKVCASTLPHADVLNNCVKDILEEKGYELKVYELNWTMQNDGVASKDYDANYFQHVPFLENYKRKDELAVACKVHYEPLSIYRGKSNGELSEGKTFEICNDTSNALRAFRLLKAKGIIENIPCDESGEKLELSTNYYKEGDVKITLIDEELLVSSLPDYDFAVLPCNTAYSGKVDSSRLVAKEDDPELVYTNANILAVRREDYKNDATYKAKIDVLTDALLSSEVKDYFYETYLGSMTCDETTQIDLRSEI